jgi:hypothetical protein
MDGQPVECRRTGSVSVWIGTFPSVEAAEAYFGIPVERSTPRRDPRIEIREIAENVL